MSELHKSKICPTHPGGPCELPWSEFGTCRARKDGKNLYCKSCIRTKVTENRRSRKAWKIARTNASKALEIPDRKPLVMSKKQKLDIPLVPGVSWWASLALWAIGSGARGQKEIIQCMRTKKKAPQMEDVLGEALVELVGNKLIGSVGECETRVYFRRKVA